MNTRIVHADHLMKGDIIVNVGVVDGPVNLIGVFVAIPVRGSVARLADGRIDVQTFDVVRHVSEEIVIAEVDG